MSLSQSPLFRTAPLAAVALCGSLLLALSVQTKKVRYPLSKSQQQAYKEWKVYGGGGENIKYSALDQIDTGNVKNLQVAWVYSSGEASSTNRTDMKVNPLIVDGLLYGLNPQLRLFALDAATGKVKWVYDPVQVPLKGKNIGRGDFASSTKISRGIAFYKGSDTDQRIIYAPGGGHALYCVEALTGKLITSFGENGIVDMHDNLDEVLEHPHDLHISMTSPGIIYKDLIIVGSRLSEGAQTPPGHIRAYDVHTGKVRWTFHTIPHPGEPGYDSYENKDAYKYVGGANAWGGLTLDAQRGIVFTGTGSATPDFYGAYRKGNDLFANSILALDAATGKLLWHFQSVHHDLWDWDHPCPPILAHITKDGKKLDVAVQTTKQGFIFMFDRVSGKPIHPIEEVPAPPSKLKGEQTSPTQPLPTFFKPFVRQVLTEADLFKDGISEESYQDLLARFRALEHDNMWNPPSTRGTIQNPGLNGGGEWGGPAFDPTTGILYVNENESPWVIPARTPLDEQSSGQQPRQTNYQVGKALYEANCASCHGMDRMAGKTNPALKTYPALAGPGIQLEEAGVRSLIATGQGTMPAFGHLTPPQRTAIASYVLDLKDKQREIFANSPPANLPEYYRIPYREGGFKFLTREGYPGVKPPWGHLSAIDLNTGEVIWKQTIGDYPELKAKGIHAGSENFGAPVVTAGGVVFIAATRDEKIRAFNKTTGELLWQVDLPAAGIATPAVYQVNGKEYVVIACGGGGKQRTKSGDQYVAFALPGKVSTVAKR
jgi:quinoprotein glucose dehydrogenase